MHSHPKMGYRCQYQQGFCRFAIVAKGKKQCGHSPCTHNAGFRNEVSQLVYAANRRNPDESA